MHTSREMPAKISFVRQVALIAWTTSGSSNALTEERSMIGTPASTGLFVVILELHDLAAGGKGPAKALDFALAGGVQRSLQFYVE